MTARNLARMASRVSVQELYADLHGRIVQGTLRPGESLSETKVAESYGVSRTPVREVFWRLTEDSLLRVIPQVGTFVAPINVAAVRDAQFVRETLECTAITDAATHADAKGLADLRAELAAQDGAVARGDYVAFFTSDEAMHRRLMELSGRRFVWPVIAGAKAQLDRVRFLSLENPSWLEMVFTQHHAIIDRVAAHDGASASRLMREHLRTAFAAIDRIAAEHADFFEA